MYKNFTLPCKCSLDKVCIIVWVVEWESADITCIPHFRDKGHFVVLFSFCNQAQYSVCISIWSSCLYLSLSIYMYVCMYNTHSQEIPTIWNNWLLVYNFFEEIPKWIFEMSYFLAVWGKKKWGASYTLFAHPLKQIFLFLGFLTFNPSLFSPLNSIIICFYIRRRKS